MARLRSIDDLVDDVLQRADMVDSEFVTRPEVCEYLNQEFAELRGHLRMNEGQPHKRLSRDIAVESGRRLYDLPDDFWELLSVEALIGGRTRMLEPFMENERAGLSNGPFYATFVSPMYRIANNQIEILPPDQSFTMTIRYAPSEGRYRLLQTPPDMVDGYNGYEISAVYGATAVCLEKEKSDPSFYAMQKDKILRHIDALAAQRDAGRPERVTDVTGGLANLGPFGGGWW